MTTAERQQNRRDRLKVQQALTLKNEAYARASERRAAVLDKLAAPSLAEGARFGSLQTFPLVVMDPGTMFTTRSARGMNRTNPANHYVTETWEEIAKRPPPLAKRGLLLCWATQANQHIMQRIITDRWKLTIKSLFTWDKLMIGTGYWGRSRYEYLIIATNGPQGLPVPLPSDRTPNGFIEKARRGPGGHSRKPEASYQWVEANYPTTPKLEMHCRYPRDGWTRWGNESAQ